MQRASVLCAVAAVLSSSGCSLLRERNYTPGGKVNDAGRADVQRVADRFNANSRQIQSILCDQVVIDGRAQGQPYTLDAQIAFEKPSNFRLRGRAFGHNQADLGSNGREIWCYIPQATDHKVLFCKREELGRVNLPIPFQPDWLAEALGIMEINAASYAPSGENGSLFSIARRDTTPTGRTATKRLIFDRKQDDRLVRIELIDNTSKPYVVLAKADMLEYTQDRKTGLWVPRVVKLEWPETETSLTLKMWSSQLKLNTIDADRAAVLFNRDLLSDVESVNMAELQAPPPAARRGAGYRGRTLDDPLQRAGGSSAAADLGQPEPYAAGPRRLD